MEVIKNLMESDITVDLASILVFICNSFYHAIDSLTLIKESGWSKDANNKYTYQMVWDAKDSPNGDDLFLTIEIEKGSRFGHMRFGAW